MGEVAPLRWGLPALLLHISTTERTTAVTSDCFEHFLLVIPAHSFDLSESFA